MPGWESFRWLRAGFSTRQGGRSTVYSRDGELGEQNLGWTEADQPEVVSEARQQFVAAINEGATLELVTTQQCHSGLTSVVEANHGPLRVDERTSALRGDGLLTSMPGWLLGVITADCVPVLVADTRTHAVGAFHAGWRGTLARIVEQGVATMKLRFGSRSEDLIAAIGPAIGPCCFVVGETVRSGFGGQFGYAEELFSPLDRSAVVGENNTPLRSEAHATEHPNVGAQIYLDLHEANRRQLLDSGLAPEAIYVVGECTACTYGPDGRRKYFSHRAEQGFTGRMLSVIGAVE